MSRIQREESVRTERIPVASNRAPLQVKGLDNENFHYRFVLDVDDRLDIFKQAGYEFVRHDGRGKIIVGEPTIESSDDKSCVVTKPAGRGLKLFLMKIPKKWYEEDQKAKRDEIKKVEEAMKLSPKGGDYGRLNIDRGSNS